MFSFNDKNFKNTISIVQVYLDKVSVSGTANEFLKNVAIYVQDIFKEVFNAYNDLSELDEIILTTRLDKRFNFVEEINKTIYDLFDNGSPYYNKDLSEDDKLLELFLICFSLIYGYVQELGFRTRSSLILPDPESLIKEHEAIIASASPESYKRILWVKNNLSRKIFSDFYKSAEYQNLISAAKNPDNINFKDFAQRAVNVTDNIQAFEAKLANIQNQINIIANQANFVGINNAFYDMRNKKEQDLISKEKLYVRVQELLLLIPVLELVVLIGVALFIFFKNGEYVFSFKIASIMTFPLISIMVLLFYFLRVTLFEVKELKAQLLQIDQRMAVIQFIQSYATEAKGLREHAKEGFDRFEQLIFSPIVNSDEKIPATLDGMDQLTKLLEALRK